MGEVFRICDRFHVSGRGCVYIVHHSEQIVISVGDIFFDLRGNHFKVKSLELVRRMDAETEADKIPAGITLESTSGMEVTGNILLREPCAINFLFCNHPLYQKRVDEDYEAEFQAAGRKHSCALFSFEDMEDGRLSLYGDNISGLTIYRGWMMKPEMYRLFYQKLEEKGIILINTPEEYDKYHLLPNWYDDFIEETPKTYWTPIAESNVILQKAKKETGPFIVKDFVKSRKHEWYDACYIPELSDTENSKHIIDTFVSRQAEALVGGLVLRTFENLRQIGFHDQSGMPISEEYRVFVYAGRVFAIDNYWTNKCDIDLSTEEYDWINSISAKVSSSFMTIDLARKADGRLIIMELGDGQVSGLQQINQGAFYEGWE